MADRNCFVAMREYRTLLADGTVADIALTLSDLNDETISDRFARAQNAVAYGVVSILGVEGAPQYPAIWLQLADQIAITVADEDPDLTPELKEVVARYLAVFFADIAEVAPSFPS
jgi:hypothetical protein